MSDQECLMRMLVQHKTKRVCDALLALAGANNYSYNKKMFVSNDIDMPRGLPRGAWREMGAKLLEAIDEALDDTVHTLMP